MKALYLAIFWSLWFLTFSSRTALSPVLPVIEDELHLSHTLAGGLYLFMSIGYTISLILSGILAPRVGFKRSIIISYIILAVALSISWFARDYKTLAGILFLAGVAGGLYLPSAVPLLTKLFDPKNWGKSLAIHDTAASISILSIPFLTTLTLGFLNWRGFFVMLGLACIVSVTVFALVVPDAPPQKNEERGNLGNILKRFDFWIMAFLWMVAATAAMGVYSIIPLFLVKGKDIPLETANTIFGLSRVGGVFATLVAGFIADRFGVKKILFWVFLVTGASTVGIALDFSIPLLIGILCIQAAFSNAFFAVGLVAISKLSNTGERSLFTGAIISGGTIAGMGLAPMCLGAVADYWSFELGLIVTGALTMIAAGIPFLLKDI